MGSRVGYIPDAETAACVGHGEP